MGATIQAISELLDKPGFWGLVALFVVYCLFMAYVDSLDAPTEKDSKAYKHWFKFANRLSFRLKRAETFVHLPPEEKADAAGAGQ